MTSQDLRQIHAELRLDGEVIPLRRMRRVGNTVLLDGTGYPTPDDLDRAQRLLTSNPDEHMTPDELRRMAEDMREDG